MQSWNTISFEYLCLCLCVCAYKQFKKNKRTFCKYYRIWKTLYAWSQFPDHQRHLPHFAVVLKGNLVTDDSRGHLTIFSLQDGTTIDFNISLSWNHFFFLFRKLLSVFNYIKQNFQKRRRKLKIKKLSNALVIAYKRFFCTYLKIINRSGNVFKIYQFLKVFWYLEERIRMFINILVIY